MFMAFITNLRTLKANLGTLKESERLKIRKLTEIRLWFTNAVIKFRLLLILFYFFGFYSFMIYRKIFVNIQKTITAVLIL